MLEFFASVIIISASGVLSPGPLFAATIANGTGQKVAGLKIAVGHTLVELPLVIIIGLGVLSLESFSEFRVPISILGGISIFVFAGIQIYSALKKSRVIKNPRYGLFATGVLLTGLNPFFLGWWLTIGTKLISDSILTWSFLGIFIMFGLHIWMDFAWLGLVSFISKRVTRFISGKSYKIFTLGINAVLVYFGVSFVMHALSTINNFKS